MAGRPVAVPRSKIQFCTSACTGATQFAISSLRDLNVFVSWPHLAGAHTQQLRFRLPSGQEYQRLESRFDAKALPLVGGAPTVSSVLPVAGTWIQQRNLAGVWTVEVYLDGQLNQSISVTFN